MKVGVDGKHIILETFKNERKAAVQAAPYVLTIFLFAVTSWCSVMEGGVPLGEPETRSVSGATRPKSLPAYCLGWADLVSSSNGVQVYFEPIDCNECSFVLIVPEQRGTVIAHFVVSLINFEDSGAVSQDQLHRDLQERQQNGLLHCPGGQIAQGVYRAIGSNAH